MGAAARVALIAVLAGAAIARAEPPADWFGTDRLTGRWGGRRDAFSERGIDVEAGIVSEIFGNPVGGERQSAQAVTSTSLDVWLDLARLAGWRGARFHLSGAWRAGRSLSSEDIGNVFAVQEAFGNQTIRLVSFALEQSLFDDAVRLALGRLAPGDDFATSALYCFFVQSAFCANPFGLLLDSPSFAVYPITTWGARVLATPAPWGYVATGVYQADRALARNETHGVDPGIGGDDGVLSVAELGIRTGTASSGLRGRFAIGGWYDTSPYPELFLDVRGGSRGRSGLPGRTQHGNGGGYLLAEQMLFREPDTDDEGLTPFLVVHGAPQAVSPMPFFLGTGLVYRGLVAGRDRDTTVLGVVWGTFSKDLARRQRDARAAGRRRRPPQDQELVLELGHRFDMAPRFPWLTLQPDVQYVIEPGGTGAVPDALVLGVQLQVTF